MNKEETVNREKQRKNGFHDYEKIHRETLKGEYVFCAVTAFICWAIIYSPEAQSCGAVGLDCIQPVGPPNTILSN